MNNQEPKALTDLRDQIAIKVMIALISGNHRYDSDADMAEDCYNMADAMLAERTKRGVV
jgi:hypothetical protein